MVTPPLKPRGVRQVACYGVLDVLTKVVFGYVLMSSYSIIERVECAEVAECAALQCFKNPESLKIKV